MSATAADAVSRPQALPSGPSPKLFMRAKNSPTPVLADLIALKATDIIFGLNCEGQPLIVIRKVECNSRDILQTLFKYLGDLDVGRVHTEITRQHSQCEKYNCENPHEQTREDEDWANEPVLYMPKESWLLLLPRQDDSHH
mmetsp:Transcript_24323/g.52435  ORF Transcript_24323/g.52435 Transcript_24323/m.52435 type:complete len:141 (-) Transcript_24323:763-1185(-)